jgi:hypothetical protein
MPGSGGRPPRQDFDGTLFHRSFYDFSAQKLLAKEMVARARLPFIFCKGREAFLRGLA